MAVPAYSAPFPQDAYPQQDYAYPQPQDPGPQPELDEACERELEDPITLQLDDGHTYERCAIEEWVQTRDAPTSPLTRAPLTRAINWKAAPQRHDYPFSDNTIVLQRVRQWLQEREVFEVQLQSWEEAKARFDEESALLATLRASLQPQPQYPLHAAPSAPPALAPQAGPPVHSWLLDWRRPFGVYAWENSSGKKTAEHYFTRAEEYYKRGDVPEALRWMGKAAQKGRADTAKQTRLAELLMERSQARAACAVLLQHLAEGQEDAQRHYELGFLLLRNDCRLAGSCPEDALYFLHQAVSLGRERHDGRSAHSCIRLARYCASLGAWHLQHGSGAEAHRLFVEADELHGGQGLYLQLLGQSFLRKAQRHSALERHNADLDKAESLLARAASLLKQTIAERREPAGYAVARAALADCLHGQGRACMLRFNDAQAEQRFREALAINKRMACGWGALGDALRNQGPDRLPEARSAYFDAVAIDPSNGRYEYEMSCISFSQARWDLGLQLAEAAARKSPGSALYEAQVRAFQEQLHLPCPALKPAKPVQDGWASASSSYLAN